ncbi:signal peptidase I [Plantibacter sp. Mn2098]|uniref:signal peptidase I n=1 Tax=Plantibacter sp. Mn2098 TaxID=3395266 RepID=UPI003BDD7299
MSASLIETSSDVGAVAAPEPTRTQVSAEAPPPQPARHAARPRPGERTPRWLRVVGTVVAWTVAIITIGLVLLLVVLPRVTGATPYTVATGSMTPTYPPGAVVVVRPTPFDQIKQGDVITFQLKSGEPTVVTHRVVGIDVGDKGVTLRTKGDANTSEDAAPVRKEQVRGVVWFGIPYVGYVTELGSAQQRTWIAQALGVALLAYAGYLVVRAVVDRKGRGSGAAGVEQAPEPDADAGDSDADDPDADDPDPEPDLPDTQPIDLPR